MEEIQYQLTSPGCTSSFRWPCNHVEYSEYISTDAVQGNLQGAIQDFHLPPFYTCIGSNFVSSSTLIDTSKEELNFDVVPLLLPLPSVLGTTLQVYNPVSIYPRSGFFSLTVNDQNVPITGESLLKQYSPNQLTSSAFDGYAYAHFAFGDGSANIKITSTQKSAITSFVTSPQKYGYNQTGVVSGNVLSFTMKSPRYLIVRLSDVGEVIIAADPLETNIPPSSGTGIFNVVTQYGADSSGNSVTTSAFTSAINAAGSREQGSIIYVPPGIYQVGNIILPSSTSLYLAAGSSLRFTGNRSDYTNDWTKASQGLDGTEWIRTAYGTSDIKIYGRGTIDAIGSYAQKTGKFIAHAVVPIGTTRFTFDGPIIRDGGSWTLMPTRSSFITIDHAKILNRMNLGEVFLFLLIIFSLLGAYWNTFRTMLSMYKNHKSQLAIFVLDIGTKPNFH